MKSIKKKALGILLAGAMTIGSASSVFAAEEPTTQDVSAMSALTVIDKKLSEDGIKIMYNGGFMSFTDVEPQIINDRTMLPFRTVLENMGATVSYDEATRTVTAARGTMKLTFNLDSDVISIDNNGTKSEIKTDVPFIIRDDRTLVPVRFISNALGMQVGWDSTYSTVVVVDVDSYIAELETKAPKFYKMLSKKSIDTNVTNGTFSISLDMLDKTQETPVKSALSVDVNFKGTYTDGVMGGNSTINLDIADIKKLISSIGDDVKVDQLKDITIDFAADNGIVYLKTNLLEKISQMMPEDKTIKGVAMFMDANTWIKIDIAKIVDEYPELFGGTGELLKDMAKNGMSSYKDITTSELFKKMYPSSTDATLISAFSLDTAFKSYATFDKYIKYTEKENGDYEISMDLGMEAFKELMPISLEGMTYSLKCNGAQIGNDQTCTMDYVVGTETEYGTFTIKMTGDMKASKADNVEKATVPGAALDILELISTIQNNL